MVIPPHEHHVKLGLTHYDEAAMVKKLRDAGFVAARAESNIGHNQWRMTFLARRPDTA